MKFLVDAHLPRKLAVQLQEAGHDAQHTLDLENANRTTDQMINAISIQEQRIVITKDADFVDSFFLQGKPWKLLLLSTGNIRNQALRQLFFFNLQELEKGFQEFRFIELSLDQIVFHQ